MVQARPLLNLAGLYGGADVHSLPRWWRWVMLVRAGRRRRLNCTVAPVLQQSRSLSPPCCRAFWYTLPQFLCLPARQASQLHPLQRSDAPTQRSASLCPGLLEHRCGRCRILSRQRNSHQQSRHRIERRSNPGGALAAALQCSRRCRTASHCAAPRHTRTCAAPAVCHCHSVCPLLAVCRHCFGQ